MQGPLEHTEQQPQCTESDFIKHFSSHFKDHEVALPPEVDPADPFLPHFLAATPEVIDIPPTLMEVQTVLEKLNLPPEVTIIVTRLSGIPMALPTT